MTLTNPLRPLVLVLALLIVASAHAQSFTTDPCPSVAVTTTTGAVCGTLTAVGDAGGEGFVRSFKGIPYAESTAEENRWRAPVPKAPWQDTLQADRFGPACPQSEALLGGLPQDEDCLSLNVWTPTGRGAGLPVLVFIHGGSFIGDSSAQQLYEGGPNLYDGTSLAATQKLVVVTFNYRLGALGYLAGVAGLAGNYGFLDQQLALSWVQDNIAHFGGDPAQVTLAGESAGAASVGLHLLAAPESDALFDAAVMQSNPLGIPFKDLGEARTLGRIYLRALGCWFQFDQAGCLRNKPVSELVAAQQSGALRLPVLEYGLDVFLAWTPVLDGRIITRQPLEAALAGAITKPVLLGTNRDEGYVFFAAGDPIGPLAYDTTLRLMFGADNARRVLRQYPAAADGDNRAPLSQVATDFLFTCSALAVAEATPTETYLYAFTQVPSFNLWRQFPGCQDRSCHGADLSFVFGSAGGELSFTPAEAQLSDAMLAYWGGFASRQRDPNRSRVADTPPWPVFTDAQGILELATPPTVGAPGDCAFWDGIGYNLFRLRQPLEVLQGVP